MRKRLSKNNRGGITLAETLIAVLILVMVTGVIAAGIPAASEALNKAVDASHGQVLLSTTMTALRDELATAKKISCPDGQKKIFYTDASGAECVLEQIENGIQLTKEATPGSSGEEVHPGFTKMLVSEEAATKNLFVTFDSAKYENGIVKIIGLSVCKKVSEAEKYKLSDLGTVPFEIEVIGRKG